MNLTLQRLTQNAVCTIGEITNDADGSIVVPATLELPDRNNAHGSPAVAGRIPAGVYPALRLQSPRLQYELFQLANVPDRVGIDLHIGNYPKDTDGCILLAEKADGDAVDSSKEAFDLFMQYLTGIDRFTLTVVDVVA